MRVKRLYYRKIFCSTDFIILDIRYDLNGKVLLENIVDKNESFEEQCTKFGELLELGKPVTQEVMFSAIHNEKYARELIINKRTPARLMRLLKNPPKVNSAHKPEHHHTHRELITNAAKALIKWSKTGFTKVDEKILETRENACLSCPNIVDPDMFIQKLIPSHKMSNKIGERTGDHVCDLCGCHLGKKMKLASESCPDKHPTKEGFTRWNEPI